MAKKTTTKSASRMAPKSTPKNPAKAAKTVAAAATPRIRDPRLPAPGGVIEKTYKGRELQVEVLDAGFRFDGKEWRSLTAIAMAVTGAKAINGLLFFGIAKRTPKATSAAPAAGEGGAR